MVEWLTSTQNAWVRFLWRHRRLHSSWLPSFVFCGVSKQTRTNNSPTLPFAAIHATFFWTTWWRSESLRWCHVITLTPKFMLVFRVAVFPPTFLPCVFPFQRSRQVSCHSKWHLSACPPSFLWVFYVYPRNDNLVLFTCTTPIELLNQNVSFT